LSSACGAIGCCAGSALLGTIDGRGTVVGDGVSAGVAAGVEGLAAGAAGGTASSAWPGSADPAVRRRATARPVKFAFIEAFPRCWRGNIAFHDDDFIRAMPARPAAGLSAKNPPAAKATGGLAHDPERCAAAFRKDHAPQKSQSAVATRFETIALEGAPQFDAVVLASVLTTWTRRLIGSVGSWASFSLVLPYPTVIRSAATMW
jgi:hypothetical protein